MCGDERHKNKKEQKGEACLSHHRSDANTRARVTSPALNRVETYRLQDESRRFVAREDLIRNKRASLPPQDLVTLPRSNPGMEQAADGSDRSAALEMERTFLHGACGPMRNLAVALSLICVVTAGEAGALTRQARVGVTPPRRVDVRVVDGNLNPLSGATVHLIAQLPSAGKRPAVAITDSSGKTHFEGLSEGQYVVRVQLTGFVDVTVGPFAVHEAAENPRISEIVVLLSPLAWFDGIVQRAAPRVKKP